jgi:tetratricopeptide (TPR) repeat protein
LGLVAFGIGVALAAGCGKSGKGEKPPAGVATPRDAPSRPRDRWDEIIDRVKRERADQGPSPQREKLNKAKMLAYSEGQPRVLYLTGYSLMQLAKSGPVEAYRDALDAFWLCRQLDPGFGRAHYGQGWVYYDLALNDLISRRKTSPNAAGFPTFTPDDAAAPLFEASLKEFESGLEATPELAKDSDIAMFSTMCRQKLVVYYAGKGDGRRDAGKLEEALGWYEKAAALPSSEAETLRLRVSKTLAGLGRHHAAIDSYDSILETSPVNGYALIGRAIARLGLEGLAGRDDPRASAVLTTDLRSRNRKIRVGAALVLLSNSSAADKRAVEQAVEATPQLGKELAEVQPPLK